MADLIVSPVIDLVKQKVVAYLEDRIELHLGVEEKLKKLEAVLNRIQPVANTAEEVDLEKHKDLKPWMTDLKVTVEEAKDVLDEFEYLRLKRRAEGEGVDHQVRSSPSSGKRLKGFGGRVFIPSSLYNYAKKIIPSTDPLERISSIQSKLEELDSRAVQFLLVVADRKATDREHHNQDVRKRETSSSVGERELVGRKDLLEGIISKLLEEEEEEHISVLPVVGHGGMGKTTVAQHVFNDTRVAARFQVRMWAHVSQIFDVSTLTKKMIESATPTERCVDTDSLETLQQKLKDVLKSNRFLLVLDDLWYGQNRYAMEEEWNKLCSPLAEAGGKGSKILLTSRTPEVKELYGALTTMIPLQGLTKEECWSIMQKSVFRGNGIPSRDLTEIGRQIALKVQGSPLAAKVVGGILRKELSWRYWSSILKTELSNLPGNDMMPILRLSYHYLPPHLRQCFAYCSLFPKGHIFNVDKLVRMWVAHGYIRELPLGEMTEEDMGKSYFHDLLSAGFFTRQIDVDESYVVMHDLMNDLARFVTKDEIVRIEEDTHGYIPKTVRHLSVRTDYLAELTKNKCNLRDLQSFLLFRRGRDYIDLDDKLVKEVLKQLRRVRVLDLNWCKVKELPDDISDWIHLRYLDLSYTQICRLPDSLWRLYHLQVLSIVDDYESRPLEICSLEKLNNLVKLRFVGINQLVKLTEEGRGSQIQNLKALNDLGVSLYPYGIHYIESGAAAREAYLCRKKRLQQLYLQWWEHCSSDVAQTEVLEGRQPPTSIERLDINGYAGMVWPNWMSIPSLENLHSIELYNLFHSDCLPPLGQLPFLQSLHLESLPRVRKLSQEGFPSLNTLVIRYMNELEEWSGPDGSGGLPCLRVFKIVKCPKLRVLPALSHTVTNLEIEAVGISSLPELIVDQEMASSQLSELWIGACGNLTSLGKGLLQNQERLNHLKKVTIGRCELLVSIPDGGLRELNSLEYLEIYYCPNLTWAAPSKDVDRGLLPSSLEELTISHIGDKALSRCLPHLSNLSKLTIVWCPYLKQILLPEEQAYLTSLQELCIYFCEALKTSGLEGLQALLSLKVLRINNCPGLLVGTSLISAADDREGMVIGPFPLALEGLEIDDPLMLVNVPVLKSLTSVQEVNIKDASRLISFSLELEEWLLQNGTSLKKLIIHKAQHLLSLPKLPNSIEKLYIVNANQEFKNKYERHTGCDWYKIRHVKYIAID